MITDLVQIRRLEHQKRGENARFRAYFKSHRHSDRRLRRFGEEIEAEIDCTQCANCCRVTEVGINQRDVEKLAKFIGVSEDEFRRQFTARDDAGAMILKRGEGGCVFLEGTACTVYEARPDTCQRFPHMVRGNGSIASRMWEFVDRACYCPIVYNSLEAFKSEMGYRNHA